jgi:hypothetical protein
MADYKPDMVAFLVRKANQANAPVGILPSGDLVVNSPADGRKLASVARKYGWAATPRGLSWRYDWLGWYEGNPDIAQQLKVLTDQIAADHGTAQVYGTHAVSVRVAVRADGDG